MKQKSSSIEFMFRYADGRRLTGSYYEYDGMVRVTTAHGTKATQLGGSPGYSLARLLAKELANEFESRRVGSVVERGDRDIPAIVLATASGPLSINTGVPRRHCRDQAEGRAQGWEATLHNGEGS